MLTLNAVGVQAGLGVALVYMIVTGLANTAPILPGNAGLYQGAAVGALAMVGHAGAHAVAVSLVAPVMASVITGAAALSGSRCTAAAHSTSPAPPSRGAPDGV